MKYIRYPPNTLIQMEIRYEALLIVCLISVNARYILCKVEHISFVICLKLIVEFARHENQYCYSGHHKKGSNSKIIRMHQSCSTQRRLERSFLHVTIAIRRSRVDGCVCSRRIPSAFLALPRRRYLVVTRTGTEMPKFERNARYSGPIIYIFS